MNIFLQAIGILAIFMFTLFTIFCFIFLAHSHQLDEDAWKCTSYKEAHCIKWEHIESVKPRSHSEE